MVTSSRIVNLELVVSPSGTILIPIVGVVDVKNKTISYVYDAIIKKCKEKYVDSNVYVELIKTRFFKVLVTGDFSSTGMFPVSATSRVSDLIESMLSLERKERSFSIVDSLLHKYFSDYSKNILLTKDIFLIRNSSSDPNAEIIEVDLFNYYLNGDFSSNPTLKEGDIINIKNSNKVAVLGDIQKPIRINLENNMSYGYLVNLAIKKNENQNIAKVINYKMLNQYSNNEIDRISEIDPRYRNHIDESFLNSRIRTNKGIFSLNMDKNLHYDANPGDIVIIGDILNYIEIIGGVKNPGIYKYDSKMNIKDYINEAGNFSKLAKDKDIYIISYTNGSRNKVDSSYLPIPGDIIFIEEKNGFKSWDRFVESVNLAGTVATMSLVLYNIWRDR